MDVRVIGHPVAQESTPGEDFVMEGMQADPVDGTAQPGQERRKAREEFKVHHGVQLLPPRPAPESGGIGDQAAQAGPIFLENDQEELGLEVITGLAHGRVGQDGAAHLGEFDKPDTFGRCWPRGGDKPPGHQQQGGRKGDRYAGIPINGAHAVRGHGRMEVKSDR